MRAREILNEGPVWNAIKRTAKRLFGMGADRKRLNRQAVKDLASSMAELKKTDYDSIDKQMKYIAKQYKMSPQRLHNAWVSQFGQSPDSWIKKKL
jgi:hypothetical protein